MFAPAKNALTFTQDPEQNQVAAVKNKRADEKHDRTVLERNLFDRRSATVEALPSDSNRSASIQAASLSLVLLGTIVGDSEESRAIIMEKDKKNQNIYRQGDVVQEAVLKEILRGKVVLSYNNRDEILDMREANQFSSKIPAQIAASAELQPGYLPPEQDQRMNEVNQASPDDVPVGGQLETIRPVRRSYAPTPKQPAL